jgi:hypothetical protein
MHDLCHAPDLNYFRDGAERARRVNERNRQLPEHQHGDTVGYACFARCLVYVHTFKAGGTSLIDLVNDICVSTPQSNRHERRCQSSGLDLMEAHRGQDRRHLANCAKYSQWEKNLIENSSLTTVCSRDSSLRETPWCAHGTSWEQLDMSRAFTFTVVRDPVARLISAAYELSRRLLVFNAVGNRLPKRYHKTLWVDEMQPNGTFMIDFGAFLKDLTLDSSGEIYLMNVADPHLQPQASFTRGLSKVLPFDYIGRFERMEEVQALVRKHLGGVSSRQRVHSTDHSTWLWPAGRTYMLNSTEVREICRLYHVDYVLFDLPHPAACNRVFPMRNRSIWHAKYTVSQAWSGLPS